MKLLELGQQGASKQSDAEPTARKEDTLDATYEEVKDKK